MALSQYKIKLLDEFLAKDPDSWNFSDFDREFTMAANKKGNKLVNYQDVKSVLIEAYKKHPQYIPVVENYLKTNFSVFGNVSVEYLDIFHELFPEGLVE